MTGVVDADIGMGNEVKRIYVKKQLMELTFKASAELCPNPKMTFDAPKIQLTTKSFTINQTIASPPSIQTSILGPRILV